MPGPGAQPCQVTARPRTNPVASPHPSHSPLGGKAQGNHTVASSRSLLCPRRETSGSTPGLVTWKGLARTQVSALSVTEFPASQAASDAAPAGEENVHLRSFARAAVADCHKLVAWNNRNVRESWRPEVPNQGDSWRAPVRPWGRSYRCLPNPRWCEQQWCPPPLPLLLLASKFSGCTSVPAPPLCEDTSHPGLGVHPPPQ